MEEALSGLRVLDISQSISGPYCTKLLANWGADVIKVEPPRRGDTARHSPPFAADQPDPEKSLLFRYLNANKKSITLNLESKRGLSIFKRLAAGADVVVENLRPGALAELGLGYKVLEKLNPALVLTSISYFGQSGRYRHYRGSDLVAQALGGLMHLSGLPDREPLKAPGQQAEYLSGLTAALATLTAIYFRDETGQGQWVDISAVEAMASILEGAVLSYSYNEATRQRSGARHPTLYPSAILPCEDGYIHVDSGGEIDTLSRFINEPRLLDPRFQENPRQHADEIEALLLPHLARRKAEELFHSAQEWRLPFAPVLTIAQLLDDPQFRERSFFATIEADAPRLGEHNEEVLIGQMGYTHRDLVRLREMGVI